MAGDVIVTAGVGGCGIDVGLGFDVGVAVGAVAGSVGSLATVGFAPSPVGAPEVFPASQFVSRFAMTERP